MFFFLKKKKKKKDLEDLGGDVEAKQISMAGVHPFGPLEMAGERIVM